MCRIHHDLCPTPLPDGTYHVKLSLSRCKQGFEWRDGTSAFCQDFRSAEHAHCGQQPGQAIPQWAWAYGSWAYPRRNGAGDPIGERTPITRCGLCARIGGERDGGGEGQVARAYASEFPVLHLFWSLEEIVAEPSVSEEAKRTVELAIAEAAEYCARNPDSWRERMGPPVSVEDVPYEFLDKEDRAEKRKGKSTLVRMGLKKPD